jgi:hypothetical protein
MNATNLRVLGKYWDGAYNCLIDIEGSDRSYCARRSDNAPLNLWIIAEIDAWEGAGNIAPDWVEPEPTEPVIPPHM